MALQEAPYGDLPYLQFCIFARLLLQIAKMVSLVFFSSSHVLSTSERSSVKEFL